VGKCIKRGDMEAEAPHDGIPVPVFHVSGPVRGENNLPELSEVYLHQEW
jgi:hypothetical protein